MFIIYSFQILRSFTLKKYYNIKLYKATREAKDILPTIALDLKAILLSGDSDFLLESLPAGLIIIKDLLVRGMIPVQTDTSTGPYLKCRLYKLSSLLAKYPGLKEDVVVPFVDAFLGERYFDIGEKQIQITKLPVVNGGYSLSCFETRCFHTLFSWLATQSSPSSVQEYLKKVCGESHPIADCLNESQAKRCQFLTKSTNLSVESYFTDNYDCLFPREDDVPKWAHDSLVTGKMPKRALSIFLDQVEFFRALVEDFSLTDSSYATTFELCDYIYGLLRSHESNPKAVERYVRVGREAVCQKVVPKTKVRV